MITEDQVEKALDYIRDNAPTMAQAKANLLYIEEFLKSKRSILMQKYHLNGVDALGAQERDARADSEYLELLEGLRAAQEAYEKLRWMMLAAELKIDVWRTQQANFRAEGKIG